MNKENQSSRSVAARVGICQKSVVNIMKRGNCKAYHKYKVQKLTEVHKEKRLALAMEMLTNGDSPSRLNACEAAQSTQTLVPKSIFFRP